MGGTMVIGQGSSGVFLSHLESTYGDTASVAEVRHRDVLCKLLASMLRVLLAWMRCGDAHTLQSRPRTGVGQSAGALLFSSLPSMALRDSVHMNPACLYFIVSTLQTSTGHENAIRSLIRPLPAASSYLQNAPVYLVGPSHAPQASYSHDGHRARE